MKRECDSLTGSDIFYQFRPPLITKITPASAKNNFVGCNITHATPRRGWRIFFPEFVKLGGSGFYITDEKDNSTGTPSWNGTVRAQLYHSLCSESEAQSQSRPPQPAQPHAQSPVLAQSTARYTFPVQTGTWDI